MTRKCKEFGWRKRLGGVEFTEESAKMGIETADRMHPICGDAV